MSTSKETVSTYVLALHALVEDSGEGLRSAFAGSGVSPNLQVVGGAIGGASVGGLKASPGDTLHVLAYRNQRWRVRAALYEIGADATLRNAAGESAPGIAVAAAARRLAPVLVVAAAGWRDVALPFGKTMYGVLAAPGLAVATLAALVAALDVAVCARGYLAVAAADAEAADRDGTANFWDRVQAKREAARAPAAKPEAAKAKGGGKKKRR